MSKVILKNNIFLIAKKSSTHEKMLDYYLILPSGKYEYAFTKKYSSSCYRICCSGLPINDILYVKKRNMAVMNLAKYLNFILPYLIEYLQLA